jgi:3-mercaptopyruvate sulfurtransferase SseA
VKDLDEIHGIAAKLHTNMGDEVGQIIDGRSEEIYYQYNNHINKSLNLPYKQLMTDDGQTLKSDKEIAKVFLSHNVDTLRKCTIFCGEPLNYGSYVIELALSVMGGSEHNRIFQGGWTQY